MKNDLIYINHILDAISKIESYIADFDFKKFFYDDKTVDAVVRQILIIGEAANKCSETLKNKYHKIPWREMITTRNKMIHDYGGLVKSIVWEIAKNDLPKLQKQIVKILNDFT
jgi:hypothetical protein